MKEYKVISSRKPKKKIHPKVLNILKSLGVTLLLILIAFTVAALKKSDKLTSTTSTSTSTTTDTSSSSSSTSGSSSIINSIITTADNTDMLKEIDTLFNYTNDSILTPITNSQSYIFNRCLSGYGYSYNEANVTMNKYENKIIITYNDYSGIIRLYIFDSNHELISAFRTYMPIDTNYTSPYVVVDGKLYFISAVDERENTCLTLTAPLTIDYFDLVEEKENNYKTYDEIVNIKINCNEEGKTENGQ